MSRWPALALVDDLPGEQGIAGGGEAHRVGPTERLFEHQSVEMRLRPVEIEPRDFEAQPAEPVGLSGEQLIEPFVGR